MVQTNAGGIARIAVSWASSRIGDLSACLEGIRAATAEIAADPSVRVLILCAQALPAAQQAKAGKAALRDEIDTDIAATVESLRRVLQPVIAAVSGAGLFPLTELLSACDFAFVTPGVRLRAVEQPSRDQALTLSAAHALELGWIMEVVPDDAIGGRAEELAQEMAANDPHLVATMKARLRQVRSSPLSGANALQDESAWLDGLPGSLAARTSFDHH